MSLTVKGLIAIAFAVIVIFMLFGLIGSISP